MHYDCHRDCLHRVDLEMLNCARFLHGNRVLFQLSLTFRRSSFTVGKYFTAVSVSPVSANVSQVPYTIAISVSRLRPARKRIEGADSTESSSVNCYNNNGTI